MENWKDIKGYEGHYQVSNLGRVKSLDRIVSRSGNRNDMTLKGKLLCETITDKGYKSVTLAFNGRRITYKLHKLVAMSFLGHEPNGMKTIIDHIDNNKLNNNFTNLIEIDNRQNTSKGKLLKNKSSKYTGVSFNKGKWTSFIQIDGKNKYLGRFITEEEAYLAYKEELKKINKN